MRPRLAFVAAALIVLAAPAFAQGGRSDRAREACLDEAARQGLRVVSVGDAQEVGDYQDRLKSTVFMLELANRGRAEMARCSVRAGAAGASLTLLGRAERRPEKSRERGVEIPSLRATQERCERTARQAGYRVQRLVDQKDRFSRDRVDGRVTRLNLRRDGRDLRLVCTFDFRRDRMTTELSRR